MKLSGIKHEGKGVTKGAPPGPKGVTNGVPGAAALVPGVAVGVELVAVDETGVLVALVVAVEEVGVLEVAPPALVTVAVVVVAVATVVDIVYKKNKKIKLLRILSGLGHQVERDHYLGKRLQGGQQSSAIRIQYKFSRFEQGLGKRN